MQKAQDRRCDILQSSSELGWSNLFAEVRSYGRGEGTHFPVLETNIIISLPGSEGTSACRVGGSWWPSEHIPGLVWIKPTGGKYDEAYIITAKTVRILNLNLAASVFTQLGDYYGLPAAPDRSVRYVSGRAGRSRQSDWLVGAIRDDDPYRCWTHVHGNGLAAARCKIATRVLGCWFRPLAG